MGPRAAEALLGLAAACLLVGVAAVPAAATGGPFAVGLPGEAEPASVLITVTVAPDGDAVWQVRYAFHLGDDNATAAFEGFEADVEADPATYTGRFADRMRETAAVAESATGRGMAVRNVTVEAGVDPFAGDVGFVTYTFAWEGFAGADGNRLAAGDAIHGFFLDANATLTLSWPSGYGAESIRPAPDEATGTAVTWTGERNFGPDEPTVVVTAAAGPDEDAALGSRLRAVPLPAAAAGLVATAAAAVGAAWLGRRLRSRGRAAADEDLLTNEERVLALLRERGGRAKQQDLVAATGWSEMKTSEVVRSMRDAGDLDVVRLGRENLVALPGELEDPPEGGAGPGKSDI